MQTWQKLSQSYLYRGWRHLLRKRFRLPGGAEADFDIFGNDAFVTVAALTEDEEFILIRQFRPGPEKVLLSFAEGFLGEGESPEASARRELLEETGYEAGKVEIMKEISSSYSTGRQICLLATGCRPTGRQNLDREEFIEVLTADQTTLRGWITDPGRTDLTNIDCFYLALEKLNQKKE